MRYDERLKNLWKASSREESRYALSAARLDCEKKVIVATDGHMLAVLDVEDLIESGEKSFTIPVDALRAAQAFFVSEKRKWMKLRKDIFIRSNEDSVTVTVGSSKRGQSFEPETRTYPDWQAVTSIGKDHKFGITMSVGLLMRLADSMRGNFKAEDAVSLSVKDTESAVIVGVNGNGRAYGMLMPMRVPYKMPKRFWMEYSQ